MLYGSTCVLIIYVPLSGGPCEGQRGWSADPGQEQGEPGRGRAADLVAHRQQPRQLPRPAAAVLL